MKYEPKVIRNVLKQLPQIISILTARPLISFSHQYKTVKNKDGTCSILPIRVNAKKIKRNHCEGCFNYREEASFCLFFNKKVNPEKTRCYVVFAGKRNKSRSYIEDYREKLLVLITDVLDAVNRLEAWQINLLLDYYWYEINQITIADRYHCTQENISQQISSIIRGLCHWINGTKPKPYQKWNYSISSLEEKIN